MPTLDIYLFFNGTCAEAMRFYQATLGGKLQPVMTYDQAPESAPCPAGAAGLVMHACIELGDRMLMASDMPPEMGSKDMAGFAAALNYPTAAEARRVFDALSQGGTVTMPMTQTFWAETFGMLTDRFGTPWMVGGGARAAG